MILLDLFFTFFKIGLFTVGGGYAMIPVMQREIVDGWHWIENDIFVNFIGIAESTPGPIAINMATFVGFEMYGLLGAVCATLAVVLPSFVIILIIAKLFAKFSKNKVVKRMFWGFRPVVAGLILSAAVTLWFSAIVPAVSLKGFNFDFTYFDWWALGLFAVAMILSRIKINKKTLHPFAILGFCAIMGVLIYGLLPNLV